ncbi:MAG: class I SAM-dependent methyltransferase [bacterium]
MSNTFVHDKYEKSWVERLKNAPKEAFGNYERNWVLPPLMVKGEKVLDLASGNSIVGSYWAREYGADVTALDLSETALKDARARGVKTITGSVEDKLPFKAGIFDTVFWGDNIEHVLAPASILKEIYRVLKKGGRVILSTPNQSYWRYRLHMFIYGELPRTEGDVNDPWEWEHIRFFSPKIIKKLLEFTNFSQTKFIGVSRRRIDMIGKHVSPELFGMIMVVEGKKL